MLYQGLLRREEDETTVQTACRNTWTLKRVLRDHGILKGPTRADHHRVPGEQFSTKRPDTFTQTVASLNFKPLAVRRRTIHLSVSRCLANYALERVREEQRARSMSACSVSGDASIN